MRFRGPAVTNVNRVEGHDEVSPDAAKAGTEGSHISSAVQDGRRKMSSHSHHIVEDGTQESSLCSQSHHMASANYALRTPK